MIKSLLGALTLLPAVGFVGGAHPDASVPAARDPEPQRLVVEAPIWSKENNGIEGLGWLPVTIHGKPATLVVNLNYEDDIALSAAALSRAGINLTVGQSLDSISIGSDVHRNVPVFAIPNQNFGAGVEPPKLPPVVGAVGVHFLASHYDIMYDYAGRKIQLYAFPAKAAPAGKAWLPAGFKAGGCGKMIAIPKGAATFTGMEVKIDGHPVTGVIEMQPYGGPEPGQGDEKMNQWATKALGLPDNSPRIKPITTGVGPYRGYMIDHYVDDVHISVGADTIWTGAVKMFGVLDAGDHMTPETPIMLLNLTTISKLRVFNSTSSQRVCFAKQ